MSIENDLGEGAAQAGSTNLHPTLIAESSLAERPEEVDVLVVGFGIAGGCAALEAARQGARVLVLDRAGPGECTSALAGGHFYLGGGTPVQLATGHRDSATALADYLTAASRVPDREKIRLYAEDSVEHFEWLECLGFTFERSFYPGKAVIQPETQGLMCTGNEKTFPFRDHAEPAPRGHKVPVAGASGGARLVVELLQQRLLEAGGEIRYHHLVDALVVDAAGQVVGARWRRGPEQSRVTTEPAPTGFVGASAVALATGGFAHNAAMVEKYAPRIAAPTRPLGVLHDDGLGIRLGASAGGTLAHMDGVFLSSPLYPPASVLHGVVVNELGARIGPEDGYHAHTAALVDAQPGGVAYLILDSRCSAHPESGLAPHLGEWATLTDLAAEVGIDSPGLLATMREYNHNAANGVDPVFHKHPDWVAPLDQPPWTVFDLSRGRATYLGFTLGGLATTVDGEVMGSAGVIPGLYAVGACASDIAQDASGYSSGTCLGEGSFFGRRAGRHAAQDACRS